MTDGEADHRIDYFLDVWDVQTLQRRFQYERPHAGNMQADVSPDGRRLALWAKSGFGHPYR